MLYLSPETNKTVVLRQILRQPMKQQAPPPSVMGGIQQHNLLLTTVCDNVLGQHLPFVKLKGFKDLSHI